MKNTTVQRWILFFAISFLSAFKCSEEERGRTLLVHNRASHPIQVYFNNNGSHYAIYPDTTITDFEVRVQNPSTIIRAGERKGITKVVLHGRIFSKLLFHLTPFH